MVHKFQIEPGNCYCLTSDGKTVYFKVTGWNDDNYVIETLDGKPITLAELTKGGLSENFDLVKIKCPQI